MTTARPNAPYDLRLRDRSGGAVDLGLVLDVDKETGLRRVQESRVPPLSPRQSQGPVQWSHYDPRVDFVYAQRDWSEGAFEPFYEDDSRRYSSANNVDARWKGVLQLGHRADAHGSFLVVNPGAETGLTTGWTAGTGVTLSAPAGAARTGGYGFRLVTDGLRGANVVLASQTITSGTRGSAVVGTGILTGDPAAWDGRSFRVGAYLRRTVAAGSGVFVRVALTGTTPATTDGATVTDAIFTQSLTAAIIPAGAVLTQITIQILSSAIETGASTYEFDDVFDFPLGGLECVATAEDADLLYGGHGRMVAWWDETNDVWRAAYIHASVAVTDLTEYDSDLFAAFGSANSYVFTTGDPRITGNWLASALVPPADKARYWAKRGKPTAGTATYQLWKDEDGINIRSSTNPRNAGSWATAFQIGSADRVITKLYALGDAIVAGKEDGLWQYRNEDAGGNVADDFENIAYDYEVAVASDNFSRGAVWRGKLYIMSSQQAFAEYNAYTRQFTDMSALFIAPRIPNLTGRARAFAAEPQQLWVCLDTVPPNTFPAKTVILASLRNVEGKWKPHTLAEPLGGVIDHMVYNRSYLYLFLRRYDDVLTDYVSSFVRYVLPARSAAPGSMAGAVRGYDVFTDANSVDIVNHTPDVAPLGVWAQSEPNGSVVTRTIQGNELRFENAASVGAGSVAELNGPTMTLDANGIVRARLLTYVTTQGAAYATLRPGTGIYLRFIDSSTFLFLGVNKIAAGGFRLELWRVASGTFTAISNEGAYTFQASGASLTSAITLEVHLSGSTIRAYLNGIERLTATETSYRTANRHGLAGAERGSGDTWLSSTEADWDDFEFRNALPEDDMPPSGTIDLPMLGTETPNTPKAWLGCDVLVADASSGRTVEVRFGMDGKPPETLSLGTITNAGFGVQSISFNSLTRPDRVAVGRVLQPRLVFTSDRRISPKVYAIAFHATIRPDRVRAWEAYVRITGTLRSGFDDPRAKAAILTDLTTLENQDYPIELIHDFDQDGAETTVRTYLIDVRLVEADADKGDVYRLVLQEVAAG